MNPAQILLNDDENRKAREFIAQHYVAHGKSEEATLHVVQTGFGLSVAIQCVHCRKKLDITDHGKW